MRGCNEIRQMIDEADKPELLSFEVNQHIRRCRDCETFADQRAGLRTLLASGTRVTAPINFDAVLNARLAEVKSRRSFAWLSSAGYLRLGAATAGLVVMIFAAQYTGLFSRDAERVPAAQDMAAVAPKPVPLRPGASTVEPPEVQHVVASVPRATIGARGGTPIGARVMPRGYSAAEDGGVVLVRGTNGEMDVPMPTVSVGAQPLLYVSAGKQPARGVGASF